MSRMASSKYLLILLLAAALLPLPAGAQAETAPSAERGFGEPPPEAEILPSGLATLVLDKGHGDQRPDKNDWVTIQYIGYTPTGTKFESSYDKGKPAQFLMDQIFPGWHIGILMMVAGEKRRLWIPEHMTPKNPHGPKGAVVFDVELTEFASIPNPPEGHAKPPAEAERSPFGAFTLLLSPGDGAAFDGQLDAALAHYTLFRENGLVIDSSFSRNRPTLFPLDKVMPAFADCLKTMVEGETRLLWVPAEVAQGQWPNSPQGTLTFELELVRFIDTTSFMKPGS